MNRYYFVGDLHINDQTPASRIDDYSQTILEELSEVFKMAKDNDVKVIFFLGDIFHKPSGLSTKYINQIIETFQKSPCECYTIVGNHDIPYNRLEDVDNTSLGILFKSGVLKRLESYKVSEQIFIYGYDFDTDISFIQKPISDDLIGICLSHSYGEDTSFGSGKPEVFKWSTPNDKPFDYYILGHDHSQHKTEQLYKYSDLYRLGALTRLTSAKSDTDREVQILQLSVGEDAQYKFDKIKVNVRPASELFSTTSLDKGKIDTIDFNQSLENVLENLNFSVQSNIFDIIDAMELEDDIKNTIELYLKNNYIVRKED